MWKLRTVGLEELKRCAVGEQHSVFCGDRLLANPDESPGIVSSTSVPDWAFSVQDAAAESFYISEETDPAGFFTLRVREADCLGTTFTQ